MRDVTSHSARNEISQSSPRWLKNSWYQAGWTSELNGDEHFVRKILGEPILFFRDSDGRAAALLDRCPHRFAPLSAGTIEDGIVRCGYHGLAFGASGACIDNPHGALTSAMRVKRYPVTERFGMIWVWMGDEAACDHELIPDLSFVLNTPPSGIIRMYMPTAANYELLSDNILDLSHADYLHPTTLGGMMVGSKTSTREDGNVIIAEWLSESCDAPPSFQALVPPPAKADIWTEVRWHAPGLMILSAAATPAGVARKPEDVTITMHNMVPETATTTHYFVCSTRQFLTDDAGFSTMIQAALEKAFLQEDKPMLEKQQDRMETPDLWALNPILLPVDAGAVRARRKLEKLISAEEQARQTQPA